MNRRSSIPGEIAPIAVKAAKAPRQLFGSVNDSDDENESSNDNSHNHASNVNENHESSIMDTLHRELGFVSFKSSALKLTGGPRALHYVIPKPSTIPQSPKTNTHTSIDKICLSEEFKRATRMTNQSTTEAQYDSNCKIDVLKTKKPTWCPKQVNERA